MLSFSVPVSLSIGMMEDKVPFIKVPCRGRGFSFLQNTHIYSNVLHSVPCDVEIDVK